MSTEQNTPPDYNQILSQLKVTIQSDNRVPILIKRKTDTCIQSLENLLKWYKT